jgi:uncharacterized protein
MGNPIIRPSPMRRAFIKSLGFVADNINSLARPWLPKFKGAEITQLFIQLPYLDPIFDGYRLVQISDIHLGTTVQENHLNEVVDIVNEIKPDTIAITGDFVSHQPEEYAFPLLSALRRLIAKDVKVAVLGNHDHWTSAESIRWVLKRSSFVELRNSVLPLHRDQKLLYLAGIDDFLVNQDRIGNILDMIPEHSAAILLAHEPDFADISAATGRFGMQISGHTHGGQIQIPLVSRFLLPPRGRKYPSGQYQLNGMTLYTNRGIGTSWLKFRYRCPPEITVYNLQAN